MLSIAIASLLAAAPKQPSPSLSLTPGHWSHHAAIYADQNFWIAEGDQLWRYGAAGVGEMKRLPGNIRAIFPRGGTAEVLIDHGIYRMTGEAVQQVLALPSSAERTREIVSLGSEFVGIGYDGGVQVFSRDGVGRDLVLRVCSDVSAAEPDCRPFDLQATPGSGHLVGVNDYRIAWVRNQPYEIVLLQLDGVARPLRIQENGYKDSLARPPLDFGDSVKEPASESRRCYSAGDRLFLLRRVGEIVDGPPGIPGSKAVSRTQFVDVINLQTGELEKRVRLRGELQGLFVGLRDEATWVLYSGIPTGVVPIGGPLPVDLGIPGAMEHWLRFVDWRLAPGESRAANGGHPEPVSSATAIEPIPRTDSPSSAGAGP